MSDNRNILEKASDKAKELGNDVKEGVDTMVHGLHGDNESGRITDHGSHDIGRTLDRCNDKNSAECKFVREKAGGQPELQSH